jgi:hypothetical protein
LYQLLETEFQSQGEQKEEYTDVSPSFGVVGIFNPCLAQHVGAYHHAGHDISQHDGLFEKFKEQADNSCGQHDDA